MTTRQDIPRLSLFPLTAEVNRQGHLVIGGCDCLDLVREFGTPLYVFDEDTLRSKCAGFKKEFGSRYADTVILYAAKAFMNRALVNMFKEEGLGLDVVSKGEMYIAHSVDFPMVKVYFHGNNKSTEELNQALEWKVGKIVVDNFHELEMLSALAREKGVKQDILLRLTPGVDPHTHKFISTGITDSKFGFPLVTAEDAISRAMRAANLNLVGLHFHLGSQIFEAEPYVEAIGVVLDLAAKMKSKVGFVLKELDIGGGIGVQYTLDNPAPPVSHYAEKIVAKLTGKIKELKLAPPQLVIEPGRAMVCQAGVALYTVGAVKDIPGVRHYVSVDGGMGDNIRPAIYGAKYEALLANRATAKDEKKVTIAGKFCESGDILIRDIVLPEMSTGDILAIPDSGAYCLAMASNYNASLRPTVVLVQKGKPYLIRRRETLEDIVHCDVA